MSYVKIDKTSKDTRYETLVRGFNLRFPSSPSATQDNWPSNVYICKTESEVENALTEVLAAGQRPTIRSGGHCYEDFVANNPNGAIIDLGLMQGIDTHVPVKMEDGKSHTYQYKLLSGGQNWDTAVLLYKTSNKTLPGGSCYSVGVGGHISGGGYGLLSRLHGLTVDWVSGVDILVADKKLPDGKSVMRKLHVNAEQHPDLFKMCRGAGGGNVGIILSYYFDELPPAPARVALVMLQFPWDQFVDPQKPNGDRSNFLKFLNAYAQFYKDNDANQETWGMFSFLKLTPIVAKNIALTIQYCDKSGHLEDVKPLTKFLAAFKDFTHGPLDTAMPDATIPFIWPVPSDKIKELPHGSIVLEWLHATQTLNGSGNNQRGKYKSSYMKSIFTDDDAKALLEHLVFHQNASDSDFSQSRVSIDSYGGAINHGGPTNPGFNKLENQTAISQRGSFLKLQYQTYWSDPDNDKKHLDWMRDWFWAMHKKDGYNGTPYQGIKPNDRYEGCYINYPDVDMIDGQDKSVKQDKVNPYHWGNLYYGSSLFKELIETKKKYDPQNVFWHSMSIPVK